MAANNDVKENEITQASAQATLANLKEIRVVTTDGSSKAYGKADFMAVIAAGIKTYFSSIAAGNIAGILTADSGKAGISALADVAQVLGVAQYHTFLQSGSFDDLIVPGTWLCVPGTMEDYPSDITGGNNAQAILEVIRLGTSGLHVLQRLTMKGSGEVYIRCNNSTTSPYTWFNWTKQ